MKKTLKYDTPVVATRMTTLIRKVANRFKSECIKKGDRKLKRNVEEFIELWTEENQALVNKKAQRNQASQACCDFYCNDWY